MVKKRLHLRRDADAIVCAAGMGTRMRSALPKPAQRVGGKALLSHLLDTLREVLAPESQRIVAYNKAYLQALRAAIGDDRAQSIEWAEQKTPDGTGGAVRAGLEQVKRGKTLVVYADVPLVRAETLRQLVEQCPEGGMALLTMQMNDPYGYGRVIRDNTNRVLLVVEQAEASTEIARLQEVNAGVMVFDTARLRELLPQLPLHDNGEYYLPGMVDLFARAAAPVTTSTLEDPEEVQGANTRRQLHDLERLYSRRAALALMEAGVSLGDINRLDVRGEVEAGQDVWLDVNVVLEGRVRLGEGAQVGPGCVLRDAEIGKGAQIRAHSVLDGAEVGPGCVVGPFARLRPGTVLRAGASVGNFVETKNAELGKNTKASHLAYIGDATLGEDANVGAGVVFANYDGEKKHHSKVGSDAFIGSNAVLVAPAEIGEGSRVAAGSSITKPVPDGALAFGRSRQKNRERGGPAPKKGK